MALAERTTITPEAAAPVLEQAGSPPLAHGMRVLEIARRQGVGLRELFTAAGVGPELPSDAVVTAELEIKYAGYFARERVQADKLRRLGELPLPADLDYASLLSLSFEARQKLTVRRPATIAQAAGISGVSPSDLQNLMIELERRRRAATPT